LDGTLKILQARILGIAQEQGLINWNYGAVDGSFSPGKGGGEDIAYGHKGKGILIHTLTDGNGMPLANCTTPANGSERDQVIPLLDRIKVKTNQPGRPRKRVKVLAADKGYDSTEKRAALRQRGIRPQFPKRVWKTKKNRGRPIKISAPRFQQERCFAWFQRKYRRLVVRWERISACFDAFLSLATIHMWINIIFISGIDHERFCYLLCTTWK
jgi:hypothetical protein